MLDISYFIALVWTDKQKVDEKRKVRKFWKNRGISLFDIVSKLNKPGTAQVGATRTSYNFPRKFFLKS